MKHIDLTVKVKKNSRIYKMAEAQSKKELVMAHVGTHFDIYGEVEVPLYYMEAKGFLLDLSYITDRDITCEDIPFELIEPGDFLLIRTGSMDRHPYGSGYYFSRSTQFSWEVIVELAKTQVKFIGIDAPDLRRGEDHVKADKICLNHGVFVMENLANLGQIDVDQRLRVYTMWFEEPEVTGVKCRVVAVQP